MPVKILSSDVIAKIAAGEVVERPASVVKELVENSIDAGANSIEVHLKDAGKELIHIKDDGCGIAKGDMDQIFQRHATSKLQSIEDLQKLSSMGFRGEALYSLAAVSDIILRSKTSAKGGPASGWKDGWEIHLQASKRLELKPAALSSQGTEIKITQLFFNTPARRKFLKNNASEMQQIINVFLPYTLLYPAKRFLLSHAGKILIDLTPSTSAIDRMSHALNLANKDLFEASQEFAELNATVRMLVSSINVQRPRRDLQFIFVNNRPVENKNLSFNMNDVYRLILPPGVYPAFVLDIQIDPSEVDANIHPTKREVRLRQESRLISFVRHMTEYTLLQQGQAKSIEGIGPQETGATFINKAQSNFLKDEPASLFSTSSPAISQNPGFLKSAIGRSFETSHWKTASEDFFKSEDNLRSKFTKARFIGSFISKYLLFESEQSLFLVDQHAAQERIMFEKFDNQIKQGKIEVQPLLTPVLLKMNASEKIAWENSQENLKDVGIETSLFDEDTLAIQTQPVLLKNIENSVRMLLSGDSVARCDRTTIARRACKASIVTGDKMDISQADYQRKQLLACHDPFTCPHGRPTVVEIKESFLDKQFLRT